MKSPFIFILYLLIAISISIPSSFGLLNVFDSAEASITLDEYVEESEESSSEDEPEEETSETEEVEKELYISDLSNHRFNSKKIQIPSSLKTFISSYMFSVLIPPLA